MKYIFLIGSIFFGLTWSICLGQCVYNGDIISSFEGCNPEIGIINNADPDFRILEANSDLRTFLATVIRRTQIVMAIVAVGLIVWLGLRMVLPTNAEAKEATKGRLISIVIGFLFMIGATIIVQGLINLIYALFP